MKKMIERDYPAVDAVDCDAENVSSDCVESLKEERVHRGIVREAELGIGISDLPFMTPSQVEQEPWSIILLAVGEAPGVVVQGDQRNEAVILSLAMYELLVRHATQSAGADMSPKDIAYALALTKVEKEWDERLSVLNDGKSLEAVINSPPRQGKVKPGPVI